MLPGGPSASAIRQRYERDGYIFPIDVLTAQEAVSARRSLETAEAAHRERLPVQRYVKGNPHLTLPFVTRLLRHPRILQAVAAVLGPDLMVWGTTFFIKEAGTGDFISWHQDLTYWGLDSANEATAWLALSPATVESGCMRFVAGSHRRAIEPHRDTFAAGNMLTRGQEIAVAVDDTESTDVILAPGQMSLHHGRLFHASNPNRSADRRIGLAIRYISPDVRQAVGGRDYAVLVAGDDRFGHYLSPPIPEVDFDPDVLSLYDDIENDRAAYLYKDTVRPDR